MDNDYEQRTASNRVFENEFSKPDNSFKLPIEAFPSRFSGGLRSQTLQLCIYDWPFSPDFTFKENW